MGIKALFFGGLISLLSLPAIAGEWELEKHDEAMDIKIYTRDIAGSELREFKGITHIKAPLSAFVALMKDEQEATRWYHEMADYKIVNAVSEQEVTSYSVNKTPWPITDRDSYIHSVISQDKASKVVTIALQGKPDFKPKSSGYVRMEDLKGAWTFTPQSGGKVEVVYQIHADPGGNLPKWLINSIVVDSPFNTLRNMRLMMGKKKYLLTQYSFIDEPK